MACNERDRGNEEPCGGRCDGPLKVLGEAPVAIEPCQRSFDNPAARQNHEAFGRIGPFEDLDGPFADPPEDAPELITGIAAIGEDMAQPREALDDLGEHPLHYFTVLDVGGVDYGMGEIAVGVGQNVALAALDLFTRVIAPRPAAFRGLDALAVDHLVVLIIVSELRCQFAK